VLRLKKKKIVPPKTRKQATRHTSLPGLITGKPTNDKHICSAKSQSSRNNNDKVQKVANCGKDEVATTLWMDHWIKL